MNDMLLNKDKFYSMNKIIIVVMLVFLLIIFCFIRYLSPFWIEWAYQHEKFDLLNGITGSQVNQILDFYLGKAEIEFFGPISQLISGWAFTIFAVLFLKGKNLKLFGLSVFAYLIITRIDVLFYPLYGDAIGGAYVEARWLAHNAFNYVGLFNQPGYAVGGPKVYMFSIYPTFLAIMIKSLPWTTVFLVVNHLIAFFFATVIVCLLKNILSRLYREDIAIMCSLLLLYLPLFQSQAEAVNMEMPCALFIMLSAYALINKKINLAGIMALCAVLIKGTGVLSCAAFFLIGFFLFFSRSELRHNKKLLFWGAGLMIFALAKVASKYLINDQHVSVGMLSFARGWPSLRHMYIFYMYIISLGIFLLFLAYNWFRRKISPFQGFYIHCVMFAYCGMWFLLFLNFLTVSPRYRVLAYPFVVFCVFSAFSILFRFHLLKKIGLVAAIIVALLSSYGYFYGITAGNYHVILERNLEYRNDLKFNQKLARIIEEEYSGYKIGAPFIIAQMLGLPDVGYVKKDLDIMIYGFNCQYGGIENFPGINNLNIAKTIYVAAQVDRKDNNPSYPVHPNDKVFRTIQYGEKKAWLFMGGVGINNVFKVTQLMQMRKRMQARSQ